MSFDDLAVTLVKRHVRDARIAMAVVALLELLSTFLVHTTVEHDVATLQAAGRLVDQDLLFRLRLQVYAGYAIAALFIALFFWAKRNPLRASIAALGCYLALTLLQVILDPRALVPGIGLFVKMVIIGALLLGVRAGRAHRALQTGGVAGQGTSARGAAAG